MSGRGSRAHVEARIKDLSFANEPARFIVAKPEMRLQQSFELAALFGGNLSVDCRGVDEQCRCRQPQFLLAQIPRVRSRVSEALEKLRKCRPRCHLALPQLPMRFGEPPYSASGRLSGRHRSQTKRC